MAASCQYPCSCLSIRVKVNKIKHCKLVSVLVLRLLLVSVALSFWTEREHRHRHRHIALNYIMIHVCMLRYAVRCETSLHEFYYIYLLSYSFMALVLIIFEPWNLQLDGEKVDQNRTIVWSCWRSYVMTSIIIIGRWKEWKRSSVNREALNILLFLFMHSTSCFLFLSLSIASATDPARRYGSFSIEFSMPTHVNGATR